MLIVLVAVGVTLCAIQCVRVPHLLICTLWLAGASALLSVMFALLGAAEVAVIELSVGAGLVTVLFVFAVGIAGESSQTLSSLVPKPLAWGVMLLVAGIFVWFIQIVPAEISAARPATLVEVMWEQRKLDVWMQLVLLFVGVLGILGLLVEAKLPVANHNRQAKGEADASEIQPDALVQPVTLVGKEQA